MIRRDARLELDATLRHPLPWEDAEALVALLKGQRPRRDPHHPVFRHPQVTELLTGESLDHATRGSRIVREGEDSRLLVSASLPSCEVLLAAGLDWLGALLTLEAGDVPGFIVPAGAARHDLRLLAWDGTRLRPLGRLPGEDTLREGCSLSSFSRAAGLPEADEGESRQRVAIRRVVRAQLAGQCLPVAQAELDAPFLQGQAMFRLWLAVTLERLDGLTTAPLATYAAA